MKGCDETVDYFLDMADRRSRMARQLGDPVALRITGHALISLVVAVLFFGAAVQAQGKANFSHSPPVPRSEHRGK